MVALSPRHPTSLGGRLISWTSVEGDSSTHVLWVVVVVGRQVVVVGGGMRMGEERWSGQMLVSNTTKATVLPSRDLLLLLLLFPIPPTSYFT